MSNFIYDEDSHSNNILGLKGDEYESMVGIDVIEQGLSLIPQSNTYHSQFKTYDMGPGK